MSHSAKLKRKAQWQEHQPCRRTELPTQSLLKPLLGSRVEHLGLAWAVREVAQGWWDGLMEAELSVQSTGGTGCSAIPLALAETGPKTCRQHLATSM